MNSKERVLTALDHKPADRVPVTNRYTPEIAAELARIVGVSSQDSFDLEVALGHDMLCTKEIGIVNAYSIISSSHNVQPNPRSVDNTMIFYWACRRYGEYRNGYLDV